MPHYKDGTEAKIGDIVKGKGYNTDHEIIGKVVNVRPGEAQAGCTLSVAYVGKASKIHVPHDDDFAAPFASCKVEADIEYGDTGVFEKIA